jgi:PHP family Zn ribbon phosphoesterase
VKEFEAARRRFGFPVLRVRNHDDIVTRAKPVSFMNPRAYQHVGSLLYLDDVGYMYTSDASLGLARYAMPAGMAESVEKIPFIDPSDAYSDHSMAGYLRKLGREYAVMIAAADNAGVARCEFDAMYHAPRGR